MSGITQSSSDSQVATGEQSQADTRQSQVATSATSDSQPTQQQQGNDQASTQATATSTIQFDEQHPDRPNPHRRGTTQYELYEARQEAARSRIRARELENANLSEQQRKDRDLDEARTSVTTLTSRVTELETDNRNLRAQIALAAHGAIHPELIASRLTEDDLVDDKTAKAAAAALKREYPQLFGAVVQGSADGANEGQAPRTSDMNQMFRARARPAAQ